MQLLMRNFLLPTRTRWAVLVTLSVGVRERLPL